ncbi:ferredoxin-type protein NapG [Thauera humireducens]|uniref:MauM/NapG family ferredoxin-type protein n=1 Tax=Thauera humireducens TaxID=1134435 RepID=UPI002467ABCC|nr:MauM/NapG family ferredoxin-type protein [Thauera humireducens]CAH1746487.1 ferredoxin-type protein NapG [Thauera humireducens]
MVPPPTDPVPAPGVSPRRQAFRRVARALGGVMIATLAARGLLGARPARAAHMLRPPGALPDADFDARCIRCGLCVQGCPFDILKLADWDDPAPTGTPFFVARQDPCRMCADLPCVRACPSGALDPLLVDVREADMGVAVLVGHESCLNYKGLSCGVCVRVCPVRGEAIALREIVRNGAVIRVPTVNTDQCTGCGSCEKHCVLSHAAIRVLPRALGIGRSGANAAGRGGVRG